MFLSRTVKPGISRPRPKSSVNVALCLCPLLLAVCFYGLWRWFGVWTQGKWLHVNEIFYLICLVVIPILLFLVLAVAGAQRFEYNRLSATYQARVDMLQKRLNHQEDFLHSIMDNNPQAVAIYDRQNNLWFINLKAAQAIGSDPGELIGKPAVRYLGAERAAKLEKRLNEVRTSGNTLEIFEQAEGEDGKFHFLQTRYELLAALGDFDGGVLVRSEDVTSLIVERERRETMLRQVIGALVAVIDRRDPYASGHSARVGQLSRAIAEELMLGEEEIEAAEIAGSLMNFGKVLVPREILTKTTALTSEELQRVRDSILTSADILSIIDFVGPVVPTLKQVLERLDGTGVPQGLKGGDILITARIVTVANAYVALVSPRAHRPSMDCKEAAQTMFKDAGRIYDRDVVAALANYIENRSNKLDWLRNAKQS